jgi:hypothetical protein
MIVVSTVQVHPEYPTVYIRNREKWSAEKCKKQANYTMTDGLGSKWHFKGSLYAYGFGMHTFNGGCTHEGEWYSGYYTPFPEIVAGYEIRRRESDWGYVIVDKSNVQAMKDSYPVNIDPQTGLIL